MIETSSAAFDGKGAEIRARLADVRRRMAAAAERAGRPSSCVTLVAVSKAAPVAAVRAAHAAGQVDFGENRAGELMRKASTAGQGIRWHFIGQLQRNKVREVIGLADLIHSVDRVELVGTIAERALAAGRVQKVLVQVNAGEDASGAEHGRGGCALDEALDLVAAVRRLDGIDCRGLMTVPALGADPRPAFGRLRGLRDAARERWPEVAHLSMGMSEDFEVAVEEGATLIRLGEAVFGSRRTAA